MFARIARLLPVVLLLATVATPAMAQDTPEGANLMREMVSYYQAKEYEKAIEVGKKLVALEKNSATHPYNMACLYALKGEKDKAVASLQRAVELKFNDFSLFKSDPDLDNIRDTDGYKKALAEMTERFEFNFDKAAAKSKPLIVVPDGVDKNKAKVIVAMHPYGGTAEWIVEKWEKVAREAGAVLVAPRAVRKVEGRPGYSWGAVDEADTLLKNALTQLASEHKIKADKMILTGFSQGAYMTFNLGMKHADKFCALVPVAGRYSSSDAKIPDGAKLKVYMMCGDKDRAISTNKRAKKALDAAGMTSELIVYEGLGHSFPEDHEAELKKAIAFAFSS